MLINKAYQSLSQSIDPVELRAPVDYLPSRLSRFIAQNNLDEIKIIVQLLKNENDWGWQHDRDSLVNNAVRDLIIAGNIEMVRYFIKQGFKVDARVYPQGQKSGRVYPLIYFAVNANDLKMVALLVENGAEIKPLKKGDDNAIKTAVKNNQTAIAQYLLVKGADANANVGSYFSPKSLIGIAAKHQNRRLIHSLVVHGADVSRALHLCNKRFLNEIKPLKNRLAHHYSDENRMQIGKYTKDKIAIEIEHKEFDTKRQELVGKLEKIEQVYNGKIKLILDFSIGTNIADTLGDKTHDFIKGLDISNFNFIGVSFEGKPATAEMLKKHGCKGVENALFTIADLEKIDDENREKDILNQLQVMFEQRGELIEDGGIINLLPLDVAVNENDLNAIDARLKADANPNRANPPLIVVAAEKGFLKAVKRLLQTKTIDDKAIVSAIAAAKKAQHDDIATLLLDNTDINSVDEKGNTLLHLAARDGNFKRVVDLIEKGASVNCQNNFGQTPLLLAIHEHEIPWSDDEIDNINVKNANGIKLLNYLLDNGADSNLYKYTSPLAQAVEKTNPDALALLIDKVDKKEVKEKSWQDESKLVPWYVPLVFSALKQEKSIELLTILKAYGASFRKLNEHGESMLYNAFYQIPSSEHDLSDDKKEILEDFQKIFLLIQFLVDNGADFSIKNESGDTPLHLLIEDKDLSYLGETYIEILEYFIAHGVDTVIENRHGATALYLAAEKGNIDAVKLLHEKGAEINTAVQSSGRTPLHIAAYRGNPKTCTLLVELGADETLRDEKGLTPPELALSAMHRDIKVFNFRENKEQPESKQKYIDARSAIANAVIKRKVQRELLRQRETLQQMQNIKTEQIAYAPVKSAASLSASL
jgi:ankyrin repeat protein